MKVDVLALGMPTCIRKAFDLLEVHKGVRHDLASLPPEAGTFIHPDAAQTPLVQL